MVSAHLILIHYQQRQRRVQLAAIEAEATAKREEETKRLQEITKAAQSEEQKGGSYGTHTTCYRIMTRRAI